MSIRHPLWEQLHSAEQQFKKELGDLAVRIRVRADELRYMPQAKELPSFAAYEKALHDWLDGGTPVLATPGCYAPKTEPET